MKLVGQRTGLTEDRVELAGHYVRSSWDRVDLPEHNVELAGHYMRLTWERVELPGHYVELSIDCVKLDRKWLELTRPRREVDARPREVVNGWYETAKNSCTVVSLTRGVDSATLRCEGFQCIFCDSHGGRS